MSNKGNKHAQNLRRRARMQAFYSQYRSSNPNIKMIKVQLIDGNMSAYPVGFCMYHQGYLTEGKCEVHKCREKQCVQFQAVERDKKGRINQTNLFEKIKR